MRYVDGTTNSGETLNNLELFIPNSVKRVYIAN